MSREPFIVRVIRHLVEEELEEGHHAFVVDVSEIVNPILERLDALMEASQTLGGEVDAVIQAVRDAEGRVQVKIGELEAEIQALTATGSPEEQAAMAKLEALKQEVAGIVPAATDATPPPADTPPAPGGETPAPPSEPAPGTPGDVPPPAPGEPAPPSEPVPGTDEPGAPPVEEPTPPVEPGGDAAGEPAPGDTPAPGGPVDAPVDAPPADTGTTQAP